MSGCWYVDLIVYSFIIWVIKNIFQAYLIPLFRIAKHSNHPVKEISEIFINALLSSESNSPAANATFYDTDYATGEIISKLEQVDPYKKSISSPAASSTFYDTDYATGKIISELERINSNSDRSGFTSPAANATFYDTDYATGKIISELQGLNLK